MVTPDREKRVQLFIIPDGQLQMSGFDSLFLVVIIIILAALPANLRISAAKYSMAAAMQIDWSS